MWPPNRRQPPTVARTPDVFDGLVKQRVQDLSDLYSFLAQWGADQLRLAGKPVTEDTALGMGMRLAREFGLASHAGELAFPDGWGRPDRGDWE